MSWIDVIGHPLSICYESVLEGCVHLDTAMKPGDVGPGFLARDFSEKQAKMTLAIIDAVVSLIDEDGNVRATTGECVDDCMDLLSSLGSTLRYIADEPEEASSSGPSDD